MSKKEEYYTLLNEAEGVLDKLFNFNVEQMINQHYMDAQQSLLKMLKEYCKDGQLAEHYLDALMRDKVAK